MAIQRYSETEEAPEETLGPTPAAPEEAPAPETPEREDTFFISPDHLSAHLDPESVKAGDVLEFKVVGRTADGELEVEYNTGGGDGSKMDKMKSDLANHMAEPEPGT